MLPPWKPSSLIQTEVAGKWNSLSPETTKVNGFGGESREMAYQENGKVGQMIAAADDLLTAGPHEPASGLRPVASVVVSSKVPGHASDVILIHLS